MEYRTDLFGGRVCLECGDPITYGRGDRKFCSDKCKNRYHNSIYHHRRAVQVKVLRALSQNYRILEDLLMRRVYSKDLIDLAHCGFNKDFATSYQKIRGRNEFRCFDIKYCLTPTRIMNIERIGVNEESTLL